MLQINRGSLIVNSINKKSKIISSSSEKLSTGLRINRAKDDAAGVAISENMRAQIRGLEQASRNIQDGISLVQVAEGALEEIGDMMHRMRELCIQGSNGTLSDKDREKLSEEGESLLKEINVMNQDTEFNGIKVLQGKGVYKDFIENEKGGLPDWVNIPSSGSLNPPISPSDPSNPPKPSDPLDLAKHSTATIDFSEFLYGDKDKGIDSLLGNGFYSTCCTCSEKYSIKFSDKDEVSTGSPNPIISVNISAVKSAEQLIDAIIDQSKPYLTHYTQFTKDPAYPTKLIMYDNRPGQQPRPDAGYGIVKPGYIETIRNEGDSDVVIQSGANSGEIKGIKLPKTDVASMGLDGVSLATQSECRNSIGVMDSAMDYISRERTRMGVYNNTLEIGNNISIIKHENLSSAESKIRDCDMAKEVINLSKNKILEQASVPIMSMYKDSLQQFIKGLL